MSDDPPVIVSSPWTVDARGYLLTPSGARAARIDNGCIMLFDKRTRTEVPLTLADYHIVQTQTPQGDG